MKQLFVFSIIYCYLFQAFSQSIYFPTYHYESENGLLYLNILSIRQDKNNILYFVTQGGVYKYSGEVFQKNQELSGLKNIRDVFFHDTSVFVVHRDKGLFFLKDKKLLPFFSVNPFKRPSDKIILLSNYCYNYTDQISVEFYDFKNKIYYNDSILIRDNLNQAFCIQKLNTKLLIGRRKGLYVIDDNKVVSLKHLSGVSVFSIFHLKHKHELYLGSSGKIIIIDDSLFQIKKVIPISINSPNKSSQFLFKLEKNISKIVVDKYNRIWLTIQPDDNIYLFDNGEVYDVLDVLNILPTLINDIYIDDFNNIWIATFNDGVYQIKSTYWQSYKINARQKILNIKQLQINQSQIIYATNNGMFYSDTNTIGHFIPIVKPDNFFNTEIFSLQKYNHQVYATNIFAFNKEVYSVNQQKITVFPFKYMAIRDVNTCYVSDITNNVMLYDCQKQRVIDTIYKPRDYKLSVRCLFYTHYELLIATTNGLIVYHEKPRNISTHLENFEIRKITTIGSNICILYENKIYNYTNNMLFLDLEKYNVVTVTDIKDYEGYYFVASEEGLLLLDNKFNLIKILGRKNGLISNVINSILIVNNKLIVATDKGISYTYLDNALNKIDLEINTPVLDYIVTNEDTLPNINNYNNYNFIFSKNTQDIFIHLICPDFNPLTKITYQYSLNDGEWINFENIPLHFSSLAGGEYTLKIRATTDNLHYTMPLVFSFKKVLSLYEEKWFWELVVILSISFITLVAFFIRKREQKKASEKLRNIQQIHLLKHRAMNAILSPHFIFNSLTGIQNYILKSDVDKASDYLSKFSRLIRMIIERAEQPDILLSDEIKRIQFYLELEKERFQNKFDFEIKIDERIKTEEIKIPNMIIQPYLENAILHGILPKKENGHLTLNFQLTQDSILEISIEDDGIGFIKGEEKKSKHHKSLATKTIAEILNINTQLYHKKQLVEIIDKSVINSSQTGTIVKITIEL